MKIRVARKVPNIPYSPFFAPASQALTMTSFTRMLACIQNCTKKLQPSVTSPHLQRQYIHFATFGLKATCTNPNMIHLREANIPCQLPTPEFVHLRAYSEAAMNASARKIPSIQAWIRQVGCTIGCTIYEEVFLEGNPRVVWSIAVGWLWKAESPHHESHLTGRWSLAVLRARLMGKGL